MKTTINAKRYDSDKCEELGSITHYHNGNYSGKTYLLRASNGVLLIHRETNGQDLYLRDDMLAFDDSELSIDDFEFDEEEEARCVELGLIETVE